MIENFIQLTPDQEVLVETFNPVDAVSMTLADRGRQYGDFPGHAKITQGIKREMQRGRQWSALADHQREALEMIAHKIGRILNGNPNYKDSWHDIVGYAKLVDDDLP